MDETDIASVDSSSLLPRCTLKNSSKERHAELGNQLWTGRRRKKKKSGRNGRRRLKDDDVRGGRLNRESAPRKNRSEEFGSADAYNRPSPSSNKTHASISPSKKYRFRVMRDVYFEGDVSLMSEILPKISGVLF